MYKGVAMAPPHAITCIQKGRIVIVQVLFSQPVTVVFAKFINLLL
jgi:hypothetical protein